VIPEGPDPALARLLRWYPRAWRERYGDEFLAMVKDDLDGGAPTRRLRLSVAWAGLRERGHQVRRTGKAANRRLITAGSRTTLSLRGSIVAFIVAVLPLNLRSSPPAAWRWQATGALDTELGFVALGGVAILASALLAVPAFSRFLRAGGWPRIRRRVGWAVAATMAAAGALSWVALATAAESFDQLNLSLDYLLGVAVTGLLLAMTLGLWTSAANRTARHLERSRRVRAAEKILVAIGAAAVSIVLAASFCFTAAIQPSAPIAVLGIAGIAPLAYLTISNLRCAIRTSKRLWSAPGRG
jgi:hypothetical protein